MSERATYTDEHGTYTEKDWYIGVPVEVAIKRSCTLFLGTPDVEMEQIVMPNDPIAEIEMPGGPSFQIASDGSVQVYWEDEEAL